jgi:ketosteroid isomerase-like protein
MSKPTTTDRSARSAAGPGIRDLLERLNRGFARQDVQQILDLFAPDPQTVYLGSEAGETAIGPTQLRTLLEGLFARPETYQWRWGELHISEIGPFAWLTTEAILRVQGRERLELPYRITLVLEHRADRWLVMHYHGSEPVAVPQPSPGANIDQSQHREAVRTH